MSLGPSTECVDSPPTAWETQKKRANISVCTCNSYLEGQSETCLERSLNWKSYPPDGLRATDGAQIVQNTSWLQIKTTTNQRQYYFNYLG